ncbi:serine/threonine-protein kinase [Umezawaea sp. Da 62-37]|uniref:serine/threonine-protein kinase n=1 Tax=Umezawaea sp. Da 62-37 TaxID=3075927 RepID=UPI0028F71E08|nr:serine/threonine-protein kinase [Umezawaea sp. Da 62-37]WNV90809.1 serine/threonine-protein kinase [Umezawaea sp. Da 62-37]
MNAVGGRYLLLDELGAGAMGVVWRARDELLHREVAVKQLKLPDVDPAARELARTRAMREARIAARLQHPNAIAVYDVAVEGGLPWLVMEYLPSHSLAAVLADRGPLDPAEAARIGGRIAAALAAAHKAGIVHRDVKPGNVLIGHDGTVKLTDFGISKAVGDGTLTEAGMISGTPAYLPPEVARGETPDARSDMFSLGATLYAMTEDRSPYGPTDNNLGLIYRAATGQIDRPVRSGSLTGPMTRLLATDPALRPTATELVGLLASTTAALPAAADVRVRRAAPAPEPKARRKWLAPTVAAVVVLLLSVAGVLIYLSFANDGRGGGLAGPATTTASSDLPSDGEDPGTTAPAQGDLTAPKAANFVRDHYRSLKADPAKAWENLAPEFRQPLDQYVAFWGQYEDVTANLVDVVTTDNGYVVDVDVLFTSDGATNTEKYRVGVQEFDGRPKIISSAKL